ncbi:MAG: bifunctional diaminohydroxyphosphoribosylaminopyrimidine deaminase/5-amino-6-(5-phosphoribosylamino)uracil reductase RibD [Burkholderiales bacterium]
MNTDAFLVEALRQAHLSLHLSAPNPHVGCVLVSAQGQVLGRGHTQQAGGPHAEVMALRDAAAQGQSSAGATAYVTLEPCAHQGRTPPCCVALVQAGVTRVVACVADPNPLVAGKGLAHLRAAGIAVELLPPSHPQAVAARELNIGFFSRMLRKTPWVRLKIAASLDGTTALANGASQWITSEAARADGHAWRARACAVLTGIGTVLQDDPRLNVRGIETPRQPTLVLVDSRLQTPLDAQIFQANRSVWIYCAVPETTEAAAKEAALQARGATVIHLPDAHPDPAQRKVDLPALLRDLAQREINELHVEAGHKLNGSLLQAGLVDELLIYLAPQLLGPGQGMANLPALASLSSAMALEFTSVTQTGADVRLLARGVKRDQF